MLAFAWSVGRLRPDVAFAPVSVAERLVRLAPGDTATLAIESLGKLVSQLLELGVITAFVAVGSCTPSCSTGSGPHSRGPRTRARRRALTVAGTSAPASRPSGMGPRQPARVRARTEHRDTAAAPVAAVRAPRGLAPCRCRAHPDITSVEDHYVVDIDLRDPIVEADEWRLSVRGLVERPLELGFAEMQSRFEVIEEVSVLTCISNEVGGELVANSAWSGVRLADVLRAAGTGAGATDVVFGCADGYDVSIALGRALEPSSLLALRHNGLPLTQEHGFPCRVRVPSLYGMMNPKWVTSIQVIGSGRRGYWAKRGWTDIGEVGTQSRIDTRGPAKAGTPTWVGGVAWAGARRISGVEVSFDGGRSWREARRGRPAGQAAWTRWAIEWTPDRPGVVRVRCRAIDGTGRRQDAKRRRPHPDGATGFHAVDIEVRR